MVVSLSKMKRREFLIKTLGIGIASSLTGFSEQRLLFGKPSFFRQDLHGEDATRSIFTKIMDTARQEGWKSLPIGECMGNMGRVLLDTQYVGGTIEGPGPEVCRVVLTGLDCVTFFENVLCMSRILRKGKTSFNDLLEEITFTRYREGKLTDYTSRLHYTSDWIYDNEQKRVVRNITPEVGGEELPVKVSFMSDNPQYYSALVEFPEFIPAIARYEQLIISRKHWYIPREKVKKAQKHLQTGDIIAFATSKKGLDYAHTGMAYRDEKRRLRLLHASSKQQKVLLDTELYAYVRSVETHIGITVARPLEVPVL